MTLRTLERLREKVQGARDRADAALRRGADPLVASAAADSKTYASEALAIIDAEIAAKRERSPLPASASR